MSKSLSLHHIVITTYRRKMTISDKHCDDMYRVLSAKVVDNGAKPIAICGIGNHVHLLVDFGPDTSRAQLMKSLKQNSSLWARQCGFFPHWEGWGRKYFCFSVSADRRGACIRYINKQKEHHQHKTYIDELIELLQSAGLTYEAQYDLD